MPSQHEQVDVPRDLKWAAGPDFQESPSPLDYSQAPEEQTVTVVIDPAKRAALIAVVLIMLGGMTTAGGVAWWVHPGAGLAILGATILGTGVLIGFSA